MESTTPLLEMKNITKVFPGVKALDSVDLRINPREVLGLCGENGAGKSTLMKILSGIHSPNEGQIFLEGKPVDINKPEVAKSLGITIIHQELSLVPELSVAENIFLGDYPKLLPGIVDFKKMREESLKILEFMGFDVDPDEKVGRLGIAKQQIVEIAKGIHSNVKVLILDEPSAPLPAQDVERLLKLINRLKNEGLGIVYISHRLPEIFEITNRVTVLKDGKSVGTLLTKDLTREILVKMMVGREVSNMRLGNITSYKKKVLSVKQLSTPGLLNDISFDLFEGEVLGIAGLVGSGRTELVRAIFGADPYTGQVEVFGNVSAIKSPRDAIGLGIGLLPEDRKDQALVLGLEAYKNITLAGLDKYKSFGVINKKAESLEVRNLIRKLQVKVSSASQETRTLSGGNQQKLIIARWLYKQSKILIFDEPTRGIDVGAKEEIYNLINQFVEEGGSVIMISSELPEVLMADRILIMAQGKLITSFSNQESNEENIMRHMI